MRGFLRTVSVVILSFASTAFAQGMLYIPGSIPLDDSRRPATDILYKGVQQTPDELVALRKKGVDLSSLNPKEDTELWRDVIGRKIGSDEDTLLLRTDEPVKFKEAMTSRTGNLRFIVQQMDSTGAPREYRILASKNAHAVLLRKNLLKKLGYNVPKTLYIPRLTVQFNGEFSRKDFLKTLSSVTLGEAARWALNGDAEGTNLLEMQDLIAFESNEPFFNLSNGFMDESIINQRRILNSLIVPYSLVDVQETVNGFSWTAGRIFNGYVLLNIEYAEAFTTAREDALWILKRIEKLKRSDFEEVVKESHYPAEVSVLLLEKLLARRNDLMAKFKVKHTPFTVDTKINSGAHLVKGELTQQRWEGHAARYAYDDPESPLSAPEIRAFFKSKLLSTALAALVSKFDDFLFKGTDVEKKFMNAQIGAAQKQLMNFFKTGEFKKIPFGLFAFPSIDGDVWVSRDIVTGDYMGSDNLIQLADTLEFSLTPGVLGGAVGLPQGMQVQLGSHVRISRSYTHLKAIKSIRRALKEPYKNMLVSFMKKDAGGIFDDLLSDNYRKGGEKEKQQLLVDVMKKFNDEMQTGDSFIVSNNLSFDQFGALGYGFTDRLKFQMSLYASQFSIGRLNIVKLGENRIHIYRDHGKARLRGMGVNLTALVPILTIEFSKTTGSAETKFFNLDLTPQVDQNPDAEANMIALRQILTENSFELLKAAQKPYQLNYKFREKTNGFGLFFKDSFGVQSQDHIAIQHPEGAGRDFERVTAGRRSGDDYQGLTVETINNLLKDEFEVDDVSIPNPSSGDAGDTFKGHSNMRNSIFEVETTDSKVSGTLTDPFIEIAYRWKGWKIKGKKILNLIEEINSKFRHANDGVDLFNPKDFSSAKSFQLYAVDVNLYLYEQGIWELSVQKPEDIRRLLLAEGTFPDTRRRMGPHGDIESFSDMKDRVVRATLKAQKKFVELYREGKARESLEHGNNFVSALELLLPFHRFSELCGGSENLFVYGQLNAFREGDENGDLPVIANSKGRIGSERVRGGLYSIQSQMGIVGNEFYIYWLLRNL